MSRPIRQGQLEGNRGRMLPGTDIRRLEYGEGGFGVPAGVPMRATEFTLYARTWYRTNFFDRPVVVIPDTVFQGRIHWIYCGPVQAGVYTPFSPASNFDCDNARPGQPIFLHRPAEWDFYADVDPLLYPTIKCRVVDAAFLHVDKPALKHLVGYDSTIGVYRTIGCDANDPASLWVTDPAAAAALALLLAQLTIVSGAVTNAAAFVTDTATVAVPGTAAQCPSHVPAAGKPVLVVALSTNTGYVWIGESAAQAQANLIPLAAGQSIEISIDDTDKIWIDAAVGGEGVGIIVET